MSAESIIQEALSQFVLLRTPQELLQAFGTNALNLEQIKQLVEVFDPSIPSDDIRRFYLKTMLKNRGAQGITAEIYKSIVDDEEIALRAGSNNYESLPTLKNIVKGIREKKIPISRIFSFYDKNKDKELQDPEFRCLLEFFYVAINDAQFRKIREEFPDKPLTEQVVGQLISKWQEIVTENAPEEPQITLDTNPITQDLLTVPKPKINVNLELEKEEDEQFQDFMGVDFNIPGVKELADLLKKCKQTQEVFTDPDFPPNVKSLGPKFSANTWQRLQDFYKGEQKVFVVDTQHSKSNVGLNKWISHRDICQGDLGDCYFMSTLSSIACKWPNQIKDLFPIERANKYGVYGVKFCINGEWKVIPLDDNIPIKNGRIAFTKNNDKEIWVSLLEKCWAKVNGSYTNIDAGDPREVIKTITGGPVWLLMTNKPNFKENFITCVKQKCVMVTGTYSKNADYSALGLEAGHAYSILNVKTIKHPQKGEIHLLKIRNPWARKEWNGDWSDESPLWTPELREQAGNTGTENDGIFFMSLEDYQKYFFSVFCGYFREGYVYNSMRCLGKKNKGMYFQFDIKTEGEYFFAVHQESSRLYRSQPELKYDYSYVRLLLCRLNNNTYEYIEGKYYKDLETHVGRVGVKFQPGRYILFIKIKWIVQSWHEHPFTLSSYGEQYVSIKQIPRDPDLIPQTMMFLCKQNKKTEEVLPGISMKIDQNGQLGIGYIHYKNESGAQCNFETNIINKGGCKLSKPERGLYFKSYLSPQQERLVTFTITPPITELSLPTLSHKML